jgi:3-oxoacyl-ACP reductase-like protein
VFGAAAATANAALALATDLADKLETYGFGEEEEDGEEDDETNEITNWGVPRRASPATTAAATSRAARAPRVPPRAVEALLVRVARWEDVESGSAFI